MVGEALREEAAEPLAADVALGCAVPVTYSEAVAPALPLAAPLAVLLTLGVEIAVGESVAVKVSDTEAERVTCTAGRDGEAAAVGEARAEALVAPVEETL